MRLADGQKDAAIAWFREALMAIAARQRTAIDGLVSDSVMREARAIVRACLEETERIRQTGMLGDA